MKNDSKWNRFARDKGNEKFSFGHISLEIPIWYFNRFVQQAVVYTSLKLRRHVWAGNVNLSDKGILVLLIVIC